MAIKLNIKMNSDYLLGILGAFIFVVGFFPISYNIQEIKNELPTKINNISLGKNDQYISNITKTVIIIIDALRLDLSNARYMPLTSGLAKNNGCSSNVSVETPTVTLPRIKALTTGSIPQFIDIVMNLANAQALQDSLIHSAKRHQKQIVFYGDETWLKLFPNQFIRSEGTNSFFVKDFKEVDNNVTRNVEAELLRNEWDMMILHYLGLDHIGHVYGPFSPLIPIKLQEMDKIIHKIYQTLSSSKKENFLLVVTSDHGMRDSGGHGGSTYGETNVPLFLIGVNCHNAVLRQCDIPVNLAVLLGLEIPSTAIGIINSKLFDFTLEKKLYILRYSLLILMQKSNICDDEFDEANQLHESYLNNHDETEAIKAIELYESCSQRLGQSLMKSSVQQNIFQLTVGVLLLANVLLGFISNICISGYVTAKLEFFLLFSVLILICVHPLVFVPIVTLLLAVFSLKIFTIVVVKPIFRNKITFFIFLQPLMFISSSFVEEEHQLWYFICSVIILFQLIYYVHRKNVKYFVFCIALSISFRFIRRLNSTGDKWANHPDLSDWFLKPDNHLFLIVFLICNLFLLYVSMPYLDRNNKQNNRYNVIGLVCVFIFKLTDSILLGRLCWLLIFFHFILFYRKTKISTWVFTIVLLLKPYNIILVPFCILTHKCIKNIVKSTELLVLCHICFGNMLFYSQGHSNSLASVDISVGYIGLYSYQPIIVFSQVLIHTYSFPILCHFLILRNNTVEDVKIWNILFCTRFCNFFIISIVTFILRHHLFIWSVFAPKLFIEFIHVLCMFFEYCFYSIVKFLENDFDKNEFLKSFSCVLFYE